ncbi:MAG: hypothetical protein FJW86_02915 [Actinobacteria bacterium]|nr:hypothetical protein [Actinomycetota bacterium]
MLKAPAVEEMVQRGIDAIDLLREDEPYKRAWAPHVRSIMSIEHAYGARARGLRSAWAAVHGSRRGLHAARPTIRTHSVRRT